MVKKNNSLAIFLLITFIFIFFYVYTLNYIIYNLDILNFIKNSPDKKIFKNLFENLKGKNIFSIIKNGEAVINLQVEILFRHVNKLIPQILILYISIISIGFCLRKYLNISEYIAYIVFFIPSFIYLVALNLKDIYLFFTIATSFLIFFFAYHNNKFNFKKYSFLIFFVFLNTYIIFFSKPYFFYLIFPIIFIFISFLWFYSLQ